MWLKVILATSVLLWAGSGIKAQIQRGAGLMGDGRYGQARLEFERKASTNTPEGAEAAAAVANTLFMEGNFKAAAEAYAAVPLV